MTLANKITIFRILLVPVFIITLLYYTPVNDYLRLVALGVFVLASVSDAVDGYLARSRNEQTLLGQILDPLADKALMISAFICIDIVGYSLPVFHLPKWLVVGMISRDVILLLGALVIHLLHRKIVQRPTKLGKATTVLSMLCIITALLQVRYSSVLWAITALAAVVSLIDYMFKGFKYLEN